MFCMIASQKYSIAKSPFQFHPIPLSERSFPPLNLYMFRRLRIIRQFVTSMGRDYPVRKFAPLDPELKATGNAPKLGGIILDVDGTLCRRSPLLLAILPRARAWQRLDSTSHLMMQSFLRCILILPETSIAAKTLPKRLS